MMVLWIHVGEEVVAEVNVLLWIWIELFHRVCLSDLLFVSLGSRFRLGLGF